MLVVLGLVWLLCGLFNWVLVSVWAGRSPDLQSLAFLMLVGPISFVVTVLLVGTMILGSLYARVHAYG